MRTLPTFLLLPFLFLMAPGRAQTGQNINHALTGTATQSADHPAYLAAVASRAIDGNRNGVWADNSCSYTAPMAAPWWQVAFTGPSLVHEILIHPRSDTNPVTTRDLLVELKSGSTVVWSQNCCTGIANPPRGVAIRLLLPPGGLTGDSVRISRPNATNEGILLAEVEVLQVAPITPVNWAIYGTAAEFPGGTNFAPANAIDGNTDYFMNNNSCAMTSVNGASGQDWWEVQLPRTRYDEVRVWPASASALYTFYVRTYDGPTVVSTQVVTNPPSTGPAVILLPGGPTPNIDRVRIFRNSFASPLAIAEVEVFNYSALDAEAKPFGIGCAGTAGIPTLRPVTPPVLSSNFDVVLRNVPANPGLAVVLSGLSHTVSGPLPLPFDFGIIGGPGCLAHVSNEFSQVAIAAGGSAPSSFAVPNNSALIGFLIYQQAIALDAGANALGLTTSNALRVRIGL